MPAEILYEDDVVFVMLDARPIAPGHTLVLPKRHVVNILELTDEEVPLVFTAVKKTTARLKATLKPDGFTIGINHDRISGQMVDHLHIHIIPRFVGDGGSSLHCVVNNPPLEPLGKIAAKILNPKS